MLHQPPSLFDGDKQAIAQALYDAGETDITIGLALRLPPMNIADWRRRKGLSENRPEPSDAVKAYMARAQGGAAPALAPPPAPSAPTPCYPPPSSAPARSEPPSSLAEYREAGRAPRALLPIGEGQAATIAPALLATGVQPEGENALTIGLDGAGTPILIDLAELMTTRLLVQGNSGSGKSHLLRKLLEESAGRVQQVVIDPEGDFASLAPVFGHTVFDATAYSRQQMTVLASRVREHRASVVLNLEGLELDDQMEFAAAFLNGLFDAPREQWHPALVVVDEAQIFAPANNAVGEESKEARRASGQAMTNLMSRGRKRGLAGVVATQRLAKLSKNVAAEASNFLMGRTFLDIDIARAGDLLGLQPRQAELIRDLERGEFLGLGPAVSRRPLKVKVAATITAAQTSQTPDAAPLPNASPAELQSILLSAIEPDAAAPAEPQQRRLRVVA